MLYDFWHDFLFTNVNYEKKYKKQKIKKNIRLVYIISFKTRIILYFTGTSPALFAHIGRIPIRKFYFEICISSNQFCFLPILFEECCKMVMISLVRTSRIQPLWPFSLPRPSLILSHLRTLIRTRFLYERPRISENCKKRAVFVSLLHVDEN